MENIVRRILFASCCLGLVCMLFVTFLPGVSAVQQAAGAAIILTWVALFHFLSSALDRRSDNRDRGTK